MRCELVNIGSELLVRKGSGSSLLVSRALSSIGIKIMRTTTVRDDAHELAAVLKEALTRCDILITIGGLGSTPDDLTRRIAADVLGLKLEFSRKAMENVARYFSSLGKKVPECCDNQAEIIHGSTLLENCKGSSPGQIIETKDKKVFVLLPGPSEEVEYIINDTLLDFLKEKFERQIKKTSVIHITGLCESEVAEKLKNVIDTEMNLEKGDIDFYYEAHIGGVDLMIEVWWDNEILVDEILHKTKAEIKNILGDNIVGEDGDTIGRVIGRLLTKKRKTLAVAESCTGGLLSSIITDAAGSSVYFKQSFITYSKDSKVKTLKVDPRTISEYGVVSEQVAREMAENVRDIAESDYAVSVTGYAGPSSDMGKEPGSGYIGLAGPENTIVKKVEFSGGRKDVKERFAVSALEMLWRELRSK
ncbi:MAG: CinA family nicotinamide mononucleotide deamidase-related protein [Elusimicrobiota bacterium]